MEKYDLLIVGNGYDLESGFKTSYIDFLNSFLNSGIRNYLISFFRSAYDRGVVVNNEWNGFENLLCQYLQFLDYLFKDNDNIERRFVEQYYDPYGNAIHRYYLITIKDFSKLPQNILLILSLINPLERLLIISPQLSNMYAEDYENVKEVTLKVFVNSTLIQSNHKYVRSLLLKELAKRLNDLENELKQYISISTGKSIPLDSMVLDIKADRIVSFNYSKTAQTVCELSDDKVAYVHGDIDSEIVVGVEQSMIDNQSFIEESDYILFFKRFRRIYKNCNKGYNNKIINQLSKESTIAIYGHSLDLADRSLLQPLFAKKYKRYDIYCFKDVDPYKLKLVNLIGLDLYDELEKEERIRLIKVEDKPNK